MVCQKCGQIIKDESSFCVYCGAKVESGNEAEIYVPIDYTDLLDFIPEGEDILYSTLCRVETYEINKTIKWNAHVLITTAGIAYTRPTKTEFLKEHSLWVNVSIIMRFGKKKRFYLQGKIFDLIRDPNFESLEGFNERKERFIPRFRPILIWF